MSEEIPLLMQKALPQSKNHKRTKVSMKRVIFYWHIHHSILVEELTEPIKNRIEYIKKHKPEHERETRLRLMKPAKGIGLAWAEYEKITDAAWAEYKKIIDAALAEYEKITDAAWAEYDKITDAAWAEYKKIIEKLHKEQCGCTEWDGREIVFS